MITIVFIIILAATFGCGSDVLTTDGTDGRNGTNGVNGASPRCEVIKKSDGKTYLSCKNPDGSAAEAEISSPEDTKPNPDPLELMRCAYENDLYQIRYNVALYDVENTGGLKLASLAVRHKKSPGVFYQGAVMHAEGDENYGSAEIKLSAWSAKMVAEDKAEILQVGGKPEVMTCK